MKSTPIADRKDDHLSITAHGDVGFHKTGSLLDEVDLVHEAMPDMSFSDLDTSTGFLGKTLRVPLLVAAMTGGSEQSTQINRDLASLAEERGWGFALGSQRPMVMTPSIGTSYCVRDVAPTIPLLGNIGLVQARAMSTDALNAMTNAVGADALCIHLNPAMELVQPEGDRDFSHGQETFRRVCTGLRIPVIAKETGCGISFKTATRLRESGVDHVDVSGAGGTSWVAVEQQRAQGEQNALGGRFREWGIPTAASIAMVSQAGISTIIATGGVYDGLEVAKSITLGASVAGIARPLLQSYYSGGIEAVRAHMIRIESEFRTAMFLVGARTIKDLREVPRVLGPRLQSWLHMNVCV